VIVRDVLSVEVGMFLFLDRYLWCVVWSLHSLRTEATTGMSLTMICNVRTVLTSTTYLHRAGITVHYTTTVFLKPCSFSLSLSVCLKK
jgi:hypothetical protein